VTPSTSPAGRFAVAEDGMAARVLLAFLATAGLFYVNIMPALVSGLISGLGFTKEQAGLVGSANVYGAALGALSVVFLVKKIPWRASSCALLSGLILVDGLTMMLRDAEFLMALRFLHGLIGGASVGIAFAVIARTHQPDRTFGMLLVVQFGLGGLGVMLLPPLVPIYGTWILFASLIAFSLVTLAMLYVLPAFPVPAQITPVGVAVKVPDAVAWLPLVLTLLALFLFQAGNMGLYAFIIALGEHHGFAASFVQPTLGAAAWTGILGSMLVVVASTRYGRLLPLALAIGFTVVATYLLHVPAEWVFLVANIGVGITWAMVVPYLLGMAAEFDRLGQMAALAGFASKMGLASGPLAASLLLTGNDFNWAINLGALAILLSLVCVWLPARLLDTHLSRVGTLDL
jgi:predicted MFS family arabinose efflux permease